MKVIWDNFAIPSFPSLSKDITCDVVIVGAGISGLTTAYLLTQQGLSVVVLESESLGRGQTGLTSAHLSNALDDRYFVLEEKHGADGARLAAESHTAAIDLIEEIAQREQISCDLERVEGYLFSDPAKDPKELDREFSAAQRAGILVSWVSQAPWESFSTGKCILFPRQARFHPLKYLYGVARKLLPGSKLFTHTRATEIVGGPDAHVKTEHGDTVHAQHVVVATNVPINDRVVIHTKQAAYRTYMLGARIPSGSVGNALYWDTAEPYHYLRLEKSENPGEDILLIGGEDHKTGQVDDTEKPFKTLEAWAFSHFPQIKDIGYRWSGQIIETIDGLAYIGRNPLDAPNVYIVTGDSGNGLTHGTIAGMIIRDLILGRSNPWAHLYDPARKNPSAGGEFLKENLNVVPQYLDWLTPGDAKNAAELKPGSGAILREGLKKVAAYRDEHGQLHACSAVCPHLGCIMAWNSSEKTWDCPCHGSRFDPEGKVLNGPSLTDLAPIDNLIRV